jgi:uncharacterized protein (UPF0264 family)
VALGPPPEEVFALARAKPGSVLLVDTCCKDAGTSLGRRPNLLDWLSPSAVIDLCRQCRQAGVRVALAGSLGAPEILALGDARPDWFAVRGAVCAGGDRAGTVDGTRVWELVRALPR